MDWREDAPVILIIGILILMVVYNLSAEHFPLNFNMALRTRKF